MFLAAVLVVRCSQAPRDPLLTYFSDQGVSVEFPASWKTEQASQEGVWYRFFVAPSLQKQKAASATLLVASTEAGVEDYARQYIGDGKVTSTREETRQGARGRTYAFSSADGATRHTLLLLKDGSKVFGLHAQGDLPAFARSEAVLEAAARSLCLEKVESYTAVKDLRYRFEIRMPRTWPETRRFSSGKNLLVQFSSPAFAADPGGETAHASLTLTVEALDDDASLDAFYADSRSKLGAFSIISHKPWKDGYADYLTAETPLAVSKVKRFYRVSGKRGYGLAFEAREDAFPRVSRWCDLIASTLLVGDEVAP